MPPCAVGLRTCACVRLSGEEMQTGPLRPPLETTAEGPQWRVPEKASIWRCFLSVPSTCGRAGRARWEAPRPSAACALEEPGSACRRPHPAGSGQVRASGPPRVPPVPWAGAGSVTPLFVAAAGRRAEEAEVLVEAGLRGLADTFQDEPPGGGHVASGAQGGRGRSLTGPPAGRPGPERGVEEQESWQGAPVLWGRVCHLLHQVRGRGSGTLGQASQDSGGRAQTTDQLDPGAQTSAFSPVQWVWPLPVASKTTGGAGSCGLLRSQAYRRLAACSVTDSTFPKASNPSALPDPGGLSRLSSGHSCRFWHSPGHCTGGRDQNHPQKRHEKRRNGCLRGPYK